MISNCLFFTLHHALNCSQPCTQFLVKLISYIQRAGDISGLQSRADTVFVDTFYIRERSLLGGWLPMTCILATHAVYIISQEVYTLKSSTFDDVCIYR